jgi:hypothetical protein
MYDLGWLDLCVYKHSNIVQGELQVCCFFCFNNVTPQSYKHKILKNKTRGLRFSSDSVSRG